MMIRTGLFAEVEADQKANDPRNHEAESNVVELTNVFPETLPLLRVKVEEHE